MILIIVGLIVLLFSAGCWIYWLYLLTNPKPKEQVKFERSVDKMVKEIIS